jgi:hypothetical protein
MLLIQEFLRHSTLAGLQAKYFITAKRHSAFPNLVQFKYNQIESPLGEPIVQQCRGIILDETDDWRVVARPFDKFFNYGERHAAAIDWSTAKVQEKIDGSMCILYHYNGGWCVATSGMPDAGGDVNGMGMAFAELFWKTWTAHGWQLPPNTAADMTFMFELTSPWNRVVVKHEKDSLTALAARYRGGEEVSIEQTHVADFNPVRSFPLQSMDDVLKTFEAMSPLQQEGYVIVDAAFRRVKVKHPGYVAIHHMKDGFGPRRMVEIIRLGESSEVLTHFPEWREEFDKAKNTYEAVVDEIHADYDRLKDVPVQKDFAIEAVKTRCSAALFQLRAKRIASAKEMFSAMPIKSLMRLLGLRDVEEEEGAG